MKRSLISSLVVLAGAASAMAQSEPVRVLKGSPDRPLAHAEQPAEKSEKSSSSLTMMQSDGTNTFKVTIVDGEVQSAEVDGKSVPKDRIRQRDGTVEFLDDKGNVEHTMKLNIGFTGRANSRWSGRGGGNNAFGEGGAGGRGGRGGGGAQNLIEIAPRVEPPKVMLGVTMTTADETTLKRLGVERETGVFIDSVIDGLPASKGGLEPNDLIVEADGKSPLTEQDLRGILKSKNPGDEVKFKVFRKGESKDVTVKLEAYEGEKLGHANPFAEGVEIPGMEERWMQLPGGFRWEGGFDEESIQKAIEEAVKQLKANGQDFEKIKENALVELERALNELKSHKDEFKGLAEAFRQRVGDSVPRVRIMDDRGVLTPAAPAAPANPSANAQLDRIAEQLERLNTRLDELEKRLEKK
jgi:hypothetical protein